MTKTTIQQVDEALTLAYRIAHACPQQADVRIWHQLIQLCLSTPSLPKTHIT
jgi:hypothetical protein